MKLVAYILSLGRLSIVGLRLGVMIQKIESVQSDSDFLDVVAFASL